MDPSMDQLISQLEGSKAENRRLNTECLKLKKIVYILNEINVLVKPMVNNCKCISNRFDIKDKVIDLRQKLHQISSNATNDDTNCDTNCDTDCEELIHKIIDFNENSSEMFDKKEDIEEYENNEMLANKGNNEVGIKRRGRGRPPKRTSKSHLLAKAAKRATKSFTKSKKRLIQRHLPNISTKLTKIKGKVVTDEGKEVFLSRTKRLRCQWPGCDAIFRDREDLDNHNWRHTGQKAYACDWPGCNKSYSSRCYLKKHHETHIDPNVFKCLHDSCEEAFVTSVELNEHFQKAHDANKPFPCDWPGCPQQFAVKRNLKDHQIVHIDEKRFRCDWPGCEAAFKRKQQLDIHICEVHQSEGKLRCDWPGCESTFSSHNKLKIHKMRHTGEKPYKCQWPSCEWSFRQHNHLKTHMLKHSGEKPFHCEGPDCDRSFQTKQTMKFHYEKCHRLTSNDINL